MAKKWWVLLVVCAGTFMLLLDVTIVVVALPDIQSGLHTTFADVQWVVDAYALTLASLLLTAGILADRYGRRLLFVTGLVIFTGGSLLCGLAQSPLMLILSRALQGVGGAILFATSLALLAQTFHGRERGIAFGVWGAITGISTALGPILGGIITSGISWRGIFLVNLPVGIAAIAISLWQLDESKRPQASRPDWAGFATLTAGLVGLVYGLIRAGEMSWSDTGVGISLALGAVFLVAFVVVELKVQHPMFDLSLFRIPTFLGGSVAAFAMNGSLFAMLVYLVLYLQDDLGYSALGAGIRIAIISGAMFVSATISGRLSSHVPIRWLIGPGLFLVGVALITMTGLDGATTWTHLVPGFIIGGIGSGLVNPPLASTAVGVVTPERSGMASGANTTFRQIGIAVAIATYGSIFTASLQRGLTSALASQPALAGKTSELVTALKQGAVGPVVASTPPSLRAPLVEGLHSAFAGAMNDLFYVSAALALVGAVCSTLLIRSRDFVATHAPPPEPQRTPEDLATAGTSPS
jgi:EmrB/QacA subfamily drug resistance transporter